MVIAHSTACEITPAEESEAYFYSHPTLCLIDAVYSLQSRYEAIVVPLIDRYVDAYDLRPKSDRRRRPADREDTLEDLIPRLEGRSRQQFIADIVGAKRDYKPNRVEKSLVVFHMAQVLVESGVNTLAELASWAERTDLEQFKNQNPRIKGFGPVGLNYLAMLAGNEALIKPDTMIHWFLTRALGGRKLSNQDAVTVLQKGARLLGITPRSWDHAIWLYESERSRKRV